MRFVSLWIADEFSETPDELPELVTVCLKSFIRHGHEFNLCTYNKDLKVPDGIKLIDANQILPLDIVHGSYGKNSEISQFSDRFRYKLLSEYPEYCWTDTDIYLLRHVPVFEKYLTQFHIGLLKSNDANMWKQFYEFATDPSYILPIDTKEIVKVKKEKRIKFPDVRERRASFPWGYAGTILLDEWLKFKKIESDDINLFYPVIYSKWKTIYTDCCEEPDKPLSEIFPSSYGIHLWYGAVTIWNKGILYTKNSIYDKILKETEVYDKGL